MSGTPRRLELLSDQDLHTLGEPAVALLPLGSLEPHGHLPLGTDSLIAEGILARIAEQLPQTILLPTIPLGYLFKYKEWPGAVGIDPDCLTSVVTSVCEGCAKLGLQRIFVMSGHDENREAALTGLRNAFHLFGTVGVYCDWLDLAWNFSKEISSSRQEGHASEIQTSVFQFLYPKLNFKLPVVALKA